MSTATAISIFGSTRRPIEWLSNQALREGSALQAGDHRQQQPGRSIDIRRPVIDVGVIGDARGHDLGAGLDHFRRHGSAYAAQQFDRPQFRQPLCHPPDVVGGNAALGPAGADDAQIDIRLPRQGAHRGGRLDACAGLSGHGLGTLLEFAFARLHLADHRAGVGRPGISCACIGQQRPAGCDDVADCGEEPFDAAGLGRRDVDDRLVRFHRYQGAVRGYLVTWLNVPLDDFGLFQAFAQVRQIEHAHANSSTWSTAFRMRAVVGM